MRSSALWQRRIAAAVGATLAGGLLAACSGEDGLRCADEGEYRSSASAPPVRVPADLSVPEESDALQIPSGDPASESESESEADGCLERPPDYFEGGEPSG